MLYWLGIFVEQDDEAARKYLEEAAVRGDEAAQRVLVDWLWSKGEEEAAEYWGEHIGIDRLPVEIREVLFHKKAKEKLIMEAEKGNVAAMDALGDWYRDSKLYQSKTMNMAMKWYKKAMKSGETGYDDKYLARKMYLIAEMFETGKGINKDKYEANNWYVKAMEAGSKEAEKKIGEENVSLKNKCDEETSKAEKKSLKKGYNSLLKDATSGDVSAMEALGDWYCNDSEHLNFGMAIKWYKNAVKSGCEKYDDGYIAGKMYLIGKKLEYGEGVKKDHIEAVKWYKRAVENGLKDNDFRIHAIEEISKINGDNVEYMIIKALSLYEKERYGGALICFTNAAREGKSDAMVWLGKMYEEGKGVEQDYSKAMDWYIKAANIGNPDAMNNLGVMYHNGKDIGKNYDCARSWYQKAINAGCDVAKKNLDFLEEEMRNTVHSYLEKGRMLDEQGKYAEAVKCYWEIAEGGNTEAMFKLGNYYYSGLGVMQNYEEAAKWLRKAADGGFAKAMNALGWCYYNGQGVTQNYEEAVKWYRKAVEAGDVMAMNNLGNCYYNGLGIMQNYEKAVKLYRKAAEGGIKYAMNSMGDCYRYGRGIAQNYEEAVEWYQKAVEAGDEDAPKNLAEITSMKRQKGEEKDTNQKSCFITTAVCTSFHKTDDCYELTMFRNFRDKWLSKEADGNTLINEYYRIAPSIVQNIDSYPNASDIYLQIWNHYLRPCLHYIETGENMHCKKLYIEMVKALEEKFHNKYLS